MAKQPDYAALFTLRADGRYSGHWRDAQAALIGAEIGDELEIDEDVLDNTAQVICDGASIGQLPPAILRRLQTESAYGVWLDALEETDDYKLKPVVRVYW